MALGDPACGAPACVGGKCAWQAAADGSACAQGDACQSGQCAAGHCVLSDDQPYWDVAFNPFQDGTAAWAAAVAVTADGTLVAAGGTGWQEPDLGYTYGFWTSVLTSQGAPDWTKNIEWGDSPEAAQSPGIRALQARPDGSVWAVGSQYGDVVVVARAGTGSDVWIHAYGEKNLEEAGFAAVSLGAATFVGAQRSQGDSWHPWLLQLDAAGKVLSEHSWPGLSAGILGGAAWQGGIGWVGLAQEGDNRYAWIARSDVTGELVWEKSLPFPSRDGATSCAIGANGDLWAVGNQLSPSGDRDAWLGRIDPAGAITWQTTLGGTGVDSLNSIAALPGGGFIATGETAKGWGHGDLWLVRLDPAGGILWQRTYGGSDWEAGLAVVPLAENVPGGAGFLIGGSSMSKVKSKLGSTTYWADAWLLRVSPTGELRCDGSDFCTGSHIADCYDGDKCTLDLCDAHSGQCLHPKTALTGCK